MKKKLICKYTKNKITASGLACFFAQVMHNGAVLCICQYTKMR
ncbi:unknown [Prevotella sp. CAG:487]|nr:unknown [Prevotella sp. CAG:487]